jgi:hypothetical protein
VLVKATPGHRVEKSQKMFWIGQIVGEDEGLNVATVDVGLMLGINVGPDVGLVLGKDVGPEVGVEVGLDVCMVGELVLGGM